MTSPTQPITSKHNFEVVEVPPTLFPEACGTMNAEGIKKALALLSSQQKQAWANSCDKEGKNNFLWKEMCLRFIDGCFLQSQHHEQFDFLVLQ